MDDDPNHNFISSEEGYDELIATSGWPSNDHFGYPASGAPQGVYEYGSDQPFTGFDLPEHPTYAPAAYSNASYTSQYQPTASSHLFARASAYALDPPLANVASNQPQYFFPSQPQPAEAPTISPHSLQYGASSLQPVGRGILSSGFQSPAGTPENQHQLQQQQSYEFQQTRSDNNGFYYGAQNHGLAFERPQESITYSSPSNSFPAQVPQHEMSSQPVVTKPTGTQKLVFKAPESSRQDAKIVPPAKTSTIAQASQSVQHSTQTPQPRGSVSVIPQIPQSIQTQIQEALKASGSQPPSAPQTPQTTQTPHVFTSTVRVTLPDLLTGNASSRPRFDYAPFVVWSDIPIEVNGIKGPLPKYFPRRSRSGKDIVPGLDLSNLPPAPIRAPKKPRSRAKNTGQPQSKPAATTIEGKKEGSDAQSKAPTPQAVSSSESEDSSDEESEYEDEPEMHVREIRGDVRPTDPAAAMGWDAIGIIWKDPYSNASQSAEIIKNAIDEYGTLVTNLRIQIKTNSTAIEEAANRPADLPRLKATRTVLHNSLYEVINAANQHGFGPIVENLSAHLKMMNGLTTTLIECIKAEDFLGKLPRAIFSFFTKLSALTDDILKRLKFDSIQKRWNKKGDEAIKNDIATIVSNTVEAKEKAAKKEASKIVEKKALVKTPPDVDTKPKPAVEAIKLQKVEAAKQASSLVSAKRPSEGDMSSRPTKKLASEATKPALARPVPPKRPATNALAASLGMTSRPPVKAPPAKALVKPIPKKRELSPPGESRLGALLESINRPAEVPKAPVAPPRPPETPEEKKRRERKESRRHLRVRFREGADLEQIRLFKHERAEDEGRQDNMLMDAHDDRSEGMMHKQRQHGDLDEDDEMAGCQDLRKYGDLVGIDFSEMPGTTPHGKAYVTRGGNLKFTTPEQAIQELRENQELMVIYTDPHDIPPSAKEPPHSFQRDVQQPQHLRGPTSTWLQQRLMWAQQYGKTYAFQASLRVYREQQLRQEAQPMFSASNQDPASAWQQLPRGHTHSSYAPSLAALQGVSHGNAVNISWLQSTIDKLKNKPFPAVEPPEWLRSERQRSLWWEGYNKDLAVEEGADEDQQGGEYQPPPPTVTSPVYSSQQYPAQPVHYSAAQTSTAASNQLQDVLASLGLNSSNVNTQQKPWGYSPNSGVMDPNSQQNGYSLWPGDGMNGNSQDQAHANQISHQGAWDESRDRSSRSNQQGQWDDQNISHKDKNPELFDENGEYKGKKRPCRFWQGGKCSKGSKCTFLHD